MKTSQLKMIIREVVREEIRLGLQEIIGDIKQPKRKVSHQTGKDVKVVEKKDYSKNPVINDILKETASDGWETMGDKKYTSNDMGDILQSSYGKMMSDDSDNANGTLAAEMGVNPNDPAMNFLKKDYRAAMKAVDKKQGK